ncbi:VWA domain-containing protein [Pseudohaliea sp.]|uniref:VWA domain-containing protein n=1 Tax=Pseudohaliea sp. TaxID=2740289 RepID=UPI0032EB9311
MLELAQPWALLCLPLPLLVLLLVPPKRNRVAALRIPFFEQVVRVAGATAGEGSVILRRNRWQLLLAVLCWLLLVLALARPERIGEPITRTEAARDIMLAIDLSGSMDYRDFPDGRDAAVSRFEAVQRVVSEFIAAREHDRIGLIVFGDRAYIQLPFTRDLSTALQLVKLMEVGMAGVQTALGDAIGLAIHAFESSEVDHRLLILLTDGNDTVSKMTPVNAAGIAAAEAITIYTIGIGDSEASGEDRVDFGVLTELAERTGGRFFNAEDETALGSVYARIDELAVADVRSESWRPRTSVGHWLTGLALLLLLAGYGMLLLRGPHRETAR